ncbi:transcriptional regulator [Actinacidiphila sp. ITFR-21]|uniref:transcriptional regulator n=1 Tax=Actinacidiphila sp. ITFR-21 TaxID=3075199 RepID=UPI0028897B7E|nr:transcriptional regulator [Streptomyces sp. ITFR-21]WNI15726.1 transcriptional regulator [Streptomyces sp. ITFR-21]
MNAAGTFAAVGFALFVAHSVGDHWVQTSAQSAAKGRPGWSGRLAGARHVATLTATKVVVLLPVAWLLGLHLSVPGLLVGLGVDAVTHWWADRRTTLAWLAGRVGLDGFYRLGAPRPGRDDNPSLGTGAYALDQSWHHLWLLVAALLIAVV